MELKSWPQFFQPIKAGKKLHDLRSKKDRVFKVGDILTLREYDPFNGAYTGDSVEVEITFITSNDTPCAYSSAYLDRDACILSLKLVDQADAAKIEVKMASDWGKGVPVQIHEWQKRAPIGAISGQSTIGKFYLAFQDGRAEGDKEYDTIDEALAALEKYGVEKRSMHVVWRPMLSY